MSWIPFYWLGKCLGLGLLYLPGGNIPTVVFERFVVLGMDNAHHVLNSLVVPNVVEFAVSLPWRVLLVLFPSMPPPPCSGDGGGTDSATKAGKKNMGGLGTGGARRKGRGALGSQLQHLNTPTKRHTKTTSSAGQGGVSTERSGGKPGAAAVGEQGSRPPPPLPARSPSQPPTSTTAAAVVVGGGGGGLGVWGAASESNASALVDQLLRADNNDVRADAAAQGAGAISTPVRGEGVVGADGGEGASPEGGLSAGSSGGPRRRRSFGEILRSAVTGNSKVRVRDHLFDLTTASPSPPMPDGSRSRGAAPELPSRSPSRSPSSARPEPTVGGSGGTRGSNRRQEKAAPRKASASTLPAVSGGYGSRDRRRGNKKEEEVEEEHDMPGFSSLSAPPPPRSNGLTRRRPSEFGSGGGDGGGDGDEAGGGGSSDASSRTGRGRREAGGGTAAAAAAGRRSTEKTASSSSVSSNGGSSTGLSAAFSRTSAARSTTASTRTTGSRSAAAGDAGDAGTAAAIADSRAKRLAEWRKKRADKSRHEPAEKLRGTGNVNGDSGGVNEKTAVAARGGGHGTTRGGENGSIRGGVVTRSSASARADNGASPPTKSRRFRHVERFRSEMARTVPGAAPRGPQEDVAGGTVSPPAGAAGSLRQKRGLAPAAVSSSRSNRG